MVDILEMKSPIFRALTAIDMDENGITSQTDISLIIQKEIDDRKLKNIITQREMMKRK